MAGPQVVRTTVVWPDHYCPDHNGQTTISPDLSCPPPVEQRAVLHEALHEGPSAVVDGEGGDLQRHRDDVHRAVQQGG